MAMTKPGWTEVAQITGILPYTRPGEAITLDTPDEVANTILKVWDTCKVPDGSVRVGSGMSGGLELTTREAWDRYMCRTRSELSDFPITDDKGSKLSILYRFPVLHSVINALCAQEMDPVYAADPLFSAQPVDAKDEDLAKESERGMNYLVHKVIRYPEARRKVLERAHIERVGVMHIPYRQRDVWTWDGDKGAVERVYDAPACEVVPRDRFAMWPDGADPDKAVYVQVRSDMSASELIDDRDKPEDERLYTFTDEQWSKLSAPGALSTPSPDQADKPPMIVDGGPYERIDTYVRLPMKSYAGTVMPLFLVTVLRETQSVIRITPCNVSRHVPVVLFYVYDHGESLDGKSTVDIVDSASIMLNEARNAQSNIAKLNELNAMTPCGDADANTAIILGQFNQVRGQIYYPPQVQYHDGETLVEAAYYEMGRATGINDQALGQLAQTGQTATASRIALGGASLVAKQTTELLSQSDERACRVIAEQMYACGPLLFEYVSAATDAEEMEARKKAIEDADDQRAELDQALPPDPSGQDTQLPLPEPKPVKSLKKRHIGRVNFGPRVAWEIQGNTPGTDKQSKMQDTQWFLQALQEVEMLPLDPERKWELKNLAATAIKLEGTEKFIGPKPNPLDPQSQAQAMKPQQGPPQPQQGTGVNPTVDQMGMMGGAPMGGSGIGMMGNGTPEQMGMPQPGFQPQ